MTLEEEIEAEKDAARKEGREEGLKEGRRAIFEQNARLVRALEESGRLDMLGDAMSDPQVYEGMLKEFGIEH